MNDLISRQAAIDAVVKYATWLWERFHETCNVVGVADALREVPSVQPERKRGKWAVSVIRGNWNDEERRTCPECGKTFRNLDVANYCPNCGLPMETEVEE